MTFQPKEIAFLSRIDAERAGIPVSAVTEGGEIAVLFVLDDHGDKWTLIGNGEYGRMLWEASEEVRRDLELPPNAFPLKGPGWTVV